MNPPERRRVRRRSRTVFEVESALSGKIRVVEDHLERRLIVGGDTLSVFPIDGNWRRVEKDYWWRALVEVALPAHPTALLVGLGGGTQVHLLRRLVHPRRITAIERDPEILRVANDWFGLSTIAGLE